MFIVLVHRQVATAASKGQLIGLGIATLLGGLSSTLLGPETSRQVIGWFLYGVGTIATSALLVTRGRPLNILDVAARERFGWVDRCGSLPTVARTRAIQWRLMGLVVAFVAVGSYVLGGDAS